MIAKRIAVLFMKMILDLQIIKLIYFAVMLKVFSFALHNQQKLFYEHHNYQPICNRNKG
jgi:hypothetical protein